ncbi:MAG: thermonuclease family protein [Bacilli bacterium]|nr:thermonuclease family protein [Bacilli bacterium]
MKTLFKKAIFFLLCFNLFFVYVNAENIDSVIFKKCIDGDTAIFTLNNEEIKVRFLAIDTPETVHPNKEKDPIGVLASEYTCNKIKNAKKIILEYDEASSKYDKYNRFLAWVWIDDYLLQEELINLGYAKLDYLYGDYKYIEELFELEDLSKEKKIGIWSANDLIYKVEFYIDEKIITKEVYENDKINYFEPYKKGYQFIGWNYNNKLFDFDTRIKSDIKLKAIFEKNITNSEIVIFILLILAYLINKKGIKKKLKK